MAVKDKLTEEFLQALKEVEGIFSIMSFIKHSFVERGFAYFVQFKKSNTIIEFLFGAPEFQIEMIIHTSNDEYAFKDLLEIPAVEKWVNENRYVQLNKRNIRDELMWFIELVKVSLIEVE